MVQKNKILTIAIQAGLLKSIYSGSKVVTSHEHALSWYFQVTPSPLSATYDVRLDYIVGKRPQVYVMTPLRLAKGKTKLPHVYDTEKQRLCLYYPDGHEWNSSMPLAKTIVPWIYEWLYYYEFWLSSGDWLGGGIHPPASKLKN
ncbi:hypothetical protein [Mucilaginibacter sp. NFR10]|uniref:hypothetical protein n=1 Tax=Mucilaginibacter sp. NFR10 TaxID=1566292 RepID=UPI0008719B5A|nr:hypothetical protein [Mucilaginibacter sp. NFR10]SCW86842.1 hypothetical protein SAMN03159284_05177 [Mucilaginibacter sp. NFR10]